MLSERNFIILPGKCYGCSSWACNLRDFFCQRARKNGENCTVRGSGLRDSVEKILSLRVLLAVLSLILFLGLQFCSLCAVPVLCVHLFELASSIFSPFIFSPKENGLWDAVATECGASKKTKWRFARKASRTGLVPRQLESEHREGKQVFCHDQVGVTAKKLREV